MLTAFDVGVGVLVLVSAILATARGLTREVLSLATWAGSAAIAVYLYLYHSDIAQQYIADEMVAKITTVVVSFILSLVILHLLTMRIADMVVDSRIGSIDRTLGFVFGVLRGMLIAIVITLFGSWLLPNNLPGWAQEAQTRVPLENMGSTLISILPPNFGQQVISRFRSGANAQEDVTDILPPNDEGTDSTEDGSIVSASGI